MDLRDQSLKEITAEIFQLEQMSNGLTTSIENIDSKITASEWQTTYLRNISRFEGSPVQPELDKAYETVNQIQGFLDELQEIDQYPVNNLTNAAEAMNKLDNLKIKVQPWLQGKAFQKIVDAQLQLKTKVQRKISEAHQWLLEVQASFENGELLYKLVQEIGVEQPFLIPDDQGKLKLLKQNVKHKQEEDVLARIEIDFRQITDPILRQECLQRLQTILAETHESSSAK
jgi:Asp-tRNA(Asn)/Glu-tRNA(Gln) amidotransferase C subunit